jgi:Ice-binding-like
MERAASKLGIVSFVVALIATLALTASSRAATSVGLGTADSFAVLAGAGVTNTGPSVINGDLGTSPTPAVTGFGGAPNGTVNGAIHPADALAGQAQADLTTAYDNAAGQGPVNTLATELGGQTLTPGVYDSESGTFGITGALTLNGQGNPDAVFIFKTATTLISASASQVLMINGAQPCNLFWQVGSSATLGTDSVFAGNILALESIELGSGVTVLGRLLARNASVTLINDTVTRADCAVAGPGPGPGGGGGGGGEIGGGETGGGNAGGGGKGNGAGGGPGGGNGGPNVQITGVPRSGGNTGGPPGRGAPCTDGGFRAKFRIHSEARMRNVSVYLDGKLIKQSTDKQFSVWISVVGLRAGRNTIRVVAVDRRGRRDVASRSFRRCARAAPSPDFTG